MTLLAALARAKTEEDVKDAYIKALGLKSYSRRDSLLPIDERSFKGAYYTPLHIVDKAYDQLAKVLGKNWQQRYIV